MAVAQHHFGSDLESSEPPASLIRSDTLFSRARRALSNPIFPPQDSYIDLDPSRAPHNEDRQVSNVERRASSRGQAAWPPSYEMRMKEMENELAAALSESERMSVTIRELQEENAQTKGAVPVLEDVLTKARHHFDIKERALKRTIASLASDLSAAVQEKNEALRLLSQYTAHGVTFREQTPPALRFHPSSRSGIRDSNVFSRSANSGRTREVLFRDTTAGRRLEELEELSGPLSYPR
jgi:chromosome segregation ATPase